MMGGCRRGEKVRYKGWKVLRRKIFQGTLYILENLERIMDKSVQGVQKSEYKWGKKISQDLG